MLGCSAVQSGLVLLALAVGAFVASGFAGARSGTLEPLAVVRWGLVCEVGGRHALSSGTRLAAFAAATFLVVGLLFTRSLGGRRQASGSGEADVPAAPAGV